MTEQRFNLSALEQPALYLIWSNEHGAWWRPNMAGYTVKLADAGRYTRREAVGICQMAHHGYSGDEAPSEIPVALADMVEIVT